jgi:hypothetical protein
VLILCLGECAQGASKKKYAHEDYLRPSGRERKLTLLARLRGLVGLWVREVKRGMRSLFSFFFTLSCLALTPVGAVLELVQHAVELPDARVLVLTPQRLALLNAASDSSVQASHWCESPEFFRGFALAGEHAFVPASEGIDVLRVGEESLELLSQVPVSYAFSVPPLVADGHLYVLRAQRVLQIYDLANIEAPEMVAELDFKISGHAFTLLSQYAYVASRKGLAIYDVRTPAEPRKLETDLELIGNSFGAMRQNGDLLYVFADKGLNVIDVSAPADKFDMTAGLDDHVTRHQLDLAR